jgi:hypothetical protein
VSRQYPDLGLGARAAREREQSECKQASALDLNIANTASAVGAAVVMANLPPVIFLIYLATTLLSRETSRSSDAGPQNAD